MTNNEILRSLNYTFRLNENKISSIFSHVEQKIENQMITSWLKKDEDEGFVIAQDQDLSNFLNGFIIEKRGKKGPDAPIPLVDKDLNNNKILKKLKIALNLQSDDMIAILKLVDFKLSSHELTAFFRKEGHKNFRPCKNQILRNFLLGLTAKYRS